MRNSRQQRKAKTGRLGDRETGRLATASSPEISPSPHLPFSLSVRPAFTLIELLVTITIIGIMAGMMFGAIGMAREASAKAATKATIAKLNSIIMARYESYLTRRVPISTAGLAPSEAKIDRLYAIRDLIRMEMPDRQYDVDKNASPNDGPIDLPYPASGTRIHVPLPALTQQYQTRLASASTGNGSSLANMSAELLYMIVSMGSPEAMEQFSQSEIADVDGNGLPEFIDGWGHPIAFLRWAPAFSSNNAKHPMPSDIQVEDKVNHHDPFDPFMADTEAWHLIPLIYSAGPDGKLGVQRCAATSSSTGYYFAKDATTENMFTNSDFLTIGEPSAADGSDTDYQDNITNHHIEMP
jgi:prepilin-type N-terminal cleavage/methylation domain-containing protein